MNIDNMLVALQSDYKNLMDLLVLVTPPQLLLAIVALSMVVWFFNRAKGAMLVACTAAAYLIPLWMHAPGL